MNENEKNQTATQPEETNDLAKQLADCQTQINEWKDRALRTAADYENFKKRSEKERLLWISSAQSAVLLDLISIVDDFDRAFASLRQGFGGQCPSSPASQSYGGRLRSREAVSRRMVLN